MKFGKRIQALVDAALPEWKDKFLAYKPLKKRLNSLISEVLANSIRAAREQELYAAAGSRHGSSQESSSRGKRSRPVFEHGRMGKRCRLLDDEEDIYFKRILELQFKRLLERELDKLNEFVVEKEEEFVIKLQHFKEKVEMLKSTMNNEINQLDVINLQKDVVVFHGEMVLLENYCSLNYIGLLKIVKKHDRLTGAWLRLSFIPDVLRQPFYSTDILSRLVKDCESNLLSAFPKSSGDTLGQPSFERDTQGNAFEDDSLFNEDDIKEIYRNTMAALQTIRNLSRGSSTYNAFSIVPCDDDLDETGSVVEDDDE